MIYFCSLGHGLCQRSDAIMHGTVVIEQDIPILLLSCSS